MPQKTKTEPVPDLMSALQIMLARKYPSITEVVYDAR